MAKKSSKRIPQKNEDTNKKGVKKEKLSDKLFYKKEFTWNILGKQEREEAIKFADSYIDFLKSARTERERTSFAVKKAIEKGFHEIFIGKNEDLKPGDKIFYTNFKKNIALIIIGKKPIIEGTRIICSHMDTPRIDLKISPLYEDSSAGVALFKTHYYGGIKKYQWSTIPLILTGLFVKKNGKIVEVHVGDSPEDPVFSIPDLLPHLWKTIQADRKAPEVIKAEEMNVLAGAIQYEDKEEKERFKLQIMKILNEKYGIVEEDFYSAELSLVPALEPRYVGIDKSMIGGAGQDDGVCSYCGIRAITDFEKIPENTIITALFDKEEIGSNGATGAQSQWIISVINDLISKTGEKESLTNLNMALRNSNIFSADVTTVINPSFKSVHDLKTAAVLGKGVVIMKFTGHGGKYGTSDATAEFMAYIRDMLDKNKVSYQFGTLGEVDKGGGGTIAKFLAEKFNANVIDIGPGVMNMHSPYEITHICDVFSTYSAYKVFFQ
ncbi:MAG: aminopeptidase [Promethearchaeota archaeon]